jgi:hypothetical protein
MQIITIAITNINALNALRVLEEKHLIRIIDISSSDSPTLPGKILHLQEFKNWIADAETSPTVSLNTAKSSWLYKKKNSSKSSK